MTNELPSTRPEPRQATPDLLVLQRAEEATAWFFERSRRFPKSLRFTLTQRIENHLLDAVESLVIARYDTPSRSDHLTRVNLLLERMRFLLRIAKASSGCPAVVLEGMVRRLDEIGRMLHGWRSRLRGSEHRS